MVCHNQSDYKIGVIYFFRGPELHSHSRQSFAAEAVQPLLIAQVTEHRFNHALSFDVVFPRCRLLHLLAQGILGAIAGITLDPTPFCTSGTLILVATTATGLTRIETVSRGGCIALVAALAGQYLTLRTAVMILRCQPWRAKRRLVDPSSREAALLTRRAHSARGEAK